MAARYTSIQVILDRILRDSLFTGLTYEAVIDYYIDFLDIVMVPDMFQEKIAIVPIANYRGELPSDFFSLQQLLLEGKPSREATDTFHNFYHELSEYLNDKTSNVATNPCTHKIENNHIYTSMKEGEAQISYYAVPTINGELAVPAEGTFLRAFQRYVEVEFMRILFRNNKIHRAVLDHAEQQYFWAVGAYETSARRLDLSRAEAFFSTHSSLIGVKSNFQERFKKLGGK